MDEVSKNNDRYSPSSARENLTPATGSTGTSTGPPPGPARKGTDQATVAAATASKAKPSSNTKAIPSNSKAKPSCSLQKPLNKAKPSSSTSSAGKTGGGTGSTAKPNCSEKLQTSKSMSMTKGKAATPALGKTNPGPGPSIEDVNSRIDKLEKLLTQVVEGLPSASAAKPPPQPEHSISESESEKSPLEEMQCDIESESGNITFPDTRDQPLETETIVPTLAAKYAVPSSVGVPLDDEIAHTISYMMGQKLEEKSLEDAANKYPCPGNCEFLDVPKVNSSIWENLGSAVRGRDLKLQAIQKSLTKGLCALAQVLEPRNMTEELSDALALMCDANFRLNCLRKDLIKPDLNADFQRLCKSTNKVTKHLFGDDLGKQVKEMQDQRKATAGVMKSRYSYTPPQHPYRRHSDNSKQRARSAGWASRDRNPRAGNTEMPFLGYGQRQRFKNRPRDPPPHTYTPMTAKAELKQQGHNRRPQGKGQGRT